MEKEIDFNKVNNIVNNLRDSRGVDSELGKVFNYLRVNELDETKKMLQNLIASQYFTKGQSKNHLKTLKDVLAKFSDKDDALQTLGWVKRLLKYQKVK